MKGVGNRKNKLMSRSSRMGERRVGGTHEGRGSDVGRLSRVIMICTLITSATGIYINWRTNESARLDRKAFEERASDERVSLRREEKSRMLSERRLKVIEGLQSAYSNFKKDRLNLFENYFKIVILTAVEGFSVQEIDNSVIMNSWENQLTLISKSNGSICNFKSECGIVAVEFGVDDARMVSLDAMLKVGYNKRFPVHVGMVAKKFAMLSKEFQKKRALAGREWGCVSEVYSAAYDEIRADFMKGDADVEGQYVALLNKCLAVIEGNSQDF